jgi:hypothetical protein
MLKREKGIVFEDIHVNKPLDRIQTFPTRHSECKFSF